MTREEAVKDLRAKHKLIESFVQMKGLAQQHIDSYNEFIEKKLREIILAKTNCRVVCEDHPDFYLQYESIRVGLPTHPTNYDKFLRESPLFPFEARASDLTYAADIFVGIRYSFNGFEERREGIKIGRVPIMLGSKRCRLAGKSGAQLARLQECPYDPLGYFVINGSEKVILIQEQLLQNRVIVERNSKLDSIIAGVVSYTVDTKSVCCLILKAGKIYFKSSSFLKLVPIFILFKALGVETDAEVFRLVGTNPDSTEALVLSLQDSSQVLSRDQALLYLADRLGNAKYGARQRAGVTQVRNVLATVFLAHIPCRNFQYMAKARYLAFMVRRLVEGQRDPQKLDNRDYYGNKRMKCAGQLLELLFEDNFKRLNSELRESLKKALSKRQGRAPEIKYLIESRAGVITRGFEQAIATGNWIIKRFNMERKGVSQLLSRISYISSLGMMMRINSQFQKTRKIAGPRALLGSHWGVICPCDTPDGQGCGLIKNLSLCANISTSTGPLPYLPIFPFQHSSPGAVTVMQNGLPLGTTSRPAQLAQWVRSLRRKGLVDPGVNVAFTQGLVLINSDSGRLVRPLIVVSGGKSLYTREQGERIMKGTPFGQLVKEGLIEYLDVNEQDNALIALREEDITPETTHLQIDPLTILGCVAGVIPFPNHNQSPRNTYQCSMGKQALGITGLNELARMDTLNYFLVYTQKPMVKTFTIELINYEQLPAGHNASVAVMSYSGYDIEDAVMLNRAALDRGFGRVLYLRRYETTLKRYTDEVREVLVQPDAKARPRLRHLQQDGLARIGAHLSAGDVFANKMVPTLPPELLAEGKILMAKREDLQWVQEPASYKGSRPSVVDRVLITTNQNHSLIVKTLLRQTRRPQLGDKFSSRHGQKGVVGLVVAEEDLPFSESGWMPDLIMNPHGYPSRMTVGKLMELVAGKAGCFEGRQKFGTAFGGDSAEEAGRALLKAGFSYTGKDALISGTSGQYLRCFVFNGPIFYQRLKHMVQDKIHARARGRVNLLTRQPTEGRAREGGLRLGEMERDCLLAFGASALLQERLMLSSDLYECLVCQECGQLAFKKQCGGCGSGRVGLVQLPYAFKLLVQQLQSMGIRLKLNLKTQD